MGVMILWLPFSARGADVEGGQVVVKAIKTEMEVCANGMSGII